ncbi:MAG: hypothetical protein ACJA13_001136 [Paraglaciecola sp.]|jgi:hypothetical protein
MKFFKLSQILLRSALVTVVLGFAAFQANANIVLSWEASSSELNLGDTLELKLFASTDPAILGDAFVGFNLDIAFDNSILALTSSTLNSALFSPSVSTSANNVGGTVPGFPPSGIYGLNNLLATFQFDGLKAGTTNVETIAALAGGTFLSELFQPINFDAASAPINVKVAKSVPAPATLSLFLIAGLAICGRRRKA